MTNDEKRIAIASHLGAKWRQINWLGEFRVVLSFSAFPDIGPGRWDLRDGRIIHDDVPRYCCDLNAMHRAANMLSPDDLANFEQAMILRFGFTKAMNASAEERCDTLLKALNLYL